MKKYRLIVAVSIAGLGLSSALCATEPTEEGIAGAETTAAEAGVPEQLRHKDRAVSIMETPLDGTSIETFTAGLDRISEEGSEANYRNVMSALDFLLFYDIGARRDKARLYSRLNGKTPDQILEMVKTRRGKNTTK